MKLDKTSWTYSTMYIIPLTLLRTCTWWGAGEVCPVGTHGSSPGTLLRTPNATIKFWNFFIGTKHFIIHATFGNLKKNLLYSNFKWIKSKYIRSICACFISILMILQDALPHCSSGPLLRGCWWRSAGRSAVYPTISPASRVADPGGVDPDPTFDNKPDPTPTTKKKPDPDLIPKNNPDQITTY